MVLELVQVAEEDIRDPVERLKLLLEGVSNQPVAEDTQGSKLMEVMW